MSKAIAITKSTIEGVNFKLVRKGFFFLIGIGIAFFI